jgi:hypothetical protein
MGTCAVIAFHLMAQSTASHSSAIKAAANESRCKPDSRKIDGCTEAGGWTWPGR